jgi:hypothetical protein
MGGIIWAIIISIPGTMVILQPEVLSHIITIIGLDLQTTLTITTAIIPQGIITTGGTTIMVTMDITDMV